MLFSQPTVTAGGDGRVFTSETAIGILKGAFGLVRYLGVGNDAFPILGSILPRPYLQCNQGEVVRHSPKGTRLRRTSSNFTRRRRALLPAYKLLRNSLPCPLFKNFSLFRAEL